MLDCYMFGSGMGEVRGKTRQKSLPAGVWRRMPYRSARSGKIAVCVLLALAAVSLPSTARADYTLTGGISFGGTCSCCVAGNCATSPPTSFSYPITQSGLDKATCDSLVFAAAGLYHLPYAQIKQAGNATRKAALPGLQILADERTTRKGRGVRDGDRELCVVV